VSHLTVDSGIERASQGVIHGAGTNRSNDAQQCKQKGTTIMSRISKAVRNRRDTARTRREVSRAIDNAATKGVREELMTMAQHQGLPLR
jgi:hypothetical protein